MQINRKINYILISILLLGIFLRFYHINFQSAWLDEVLNLKESDPSVPFNEAYKVILLRDSTSFMYIFSVRFLSIIIGHSVFAARLISAIAGIFSILYVYKLGNIMFNKRVGYYAALLLSVNLFHIEFSQEARSYSVLILFVIISFYRLFIFINKTNVINAIYLGLFMGLAVNSHPIGLLNVATICLILIFIFLLLKERKQKLILIKHSIISITITALLFYFIYPIILAASKITSFWIPEPSLQGIKQVLSDLVGRSEYLLYFIILSIIFTSFKVIFFIKKTDAIIKNKMILGYLILMLWVFVEVGVIIVKSYLGVSILLARYLIAVLPALILFLAIAIDFIEAKFIKHAILIFLTCFSLYHVFYISNYYDTIRKAQFDKIGEFILSKNSRNDKVVSRYGFVLSAYINKTMPNVEVVESTIDGFITSLKNNGISKSSFWYFDGNSATIDINDENKIFFDQNYSLKESIELYDCFAKYYILKNEEKIIEKENEIKLFFKDFSPLKVDAQGNLVLFENSIVKSKEINIPKGNYTLILNGNSYPAEPINGENAHLVIKINNKEIDNYFLSEKKPASNREIKFTNDTGKIIISIAFDNDYLIDNLDRNLVLEHI
jgi:uncharacterized membrane protein